MRKRRWLPFLALVIAGGAGWWFRAPLIESWALVSGTAELGPRERLQPDPGTYATLKKDLERWRKDLAIRHRKSRSPAERAAVEQDARLILEQALPSMMRCWLGTRWDFNGTAKGPGEGKIACGYFVATVLKDAGFQVDRYQLARQPSENILRSFVPKKSCALSVGKEYQSFADEMEKRDPGVYVVGLDTHVAFIVVDANGFRFIHSSGSKPWCVVDEGREDAQVLQRSKWRMTGNLTADRNVLRTWLKEEKVKVTGT